ncbi:MAG: DUF11 domain-containing protein [Phycisphaerales bacterium]|nr:DUF11 domain-containing protein [Phycisphaerales bacterium]
MRKKMFGCIVLALAITTVGLVGGCETHFPHSFTLAPGDVERMHGEPAEGGYYSNWDPFAASIELTPLLDVNPVRTQHVFVATVKDKNGKPLPNRRVEWLVGEGTVGSIVEVDESGWRSTRGHKLTNKFAISHTNNFDHTLTRGNDDPSDDIVLKRGQTWCVVTSPIEGTTHMIAYAPGIYDWSKHKVFAVKHWLDVAWKLPAPAVNRIGTPHVFKTKVTKHSDGSPLVGYEVQYKILDGPAATFTPGAKPVATVLTDKEGVATVTLNQTKPGVGVNNVEIRITRPENKPCCKPAQLVHIGKTSKTWIAPAIGITKTAPATAVIGESFVYPIRVTNPAKVAANNVVLTDVLPAGIAYVSSAPKATVDGQKLTWALGTLAGGAAKSVAVTVKGTRTGTFVNVANVVADDGLQAKAQAPTRIIQPALVMTKTAPATALLCDPIPFTITVKNTGDAPAKNVVVTDQFPAGLTGLNGGTKAEFSLGTIQPGQSKARKITMKASKVGTYSNAATATGDGGLKATASSKTIVRVPVLAVTKSAPKVRYVGRAVKYTITVTNNGDAAAKNTVLVETLPVKAAFVSASNGGKLAGGKLTWQLGSLAPKASATVTVALKATSLGDLRSYSTATAYCSKASAESSTIVRGIPAILLECVDIEDPIEVGSKETYIITVTNQGSADGTNIVIKCTLPAEQDFVSAAADTKTKATAAGKVITFAPLKTLAPKAKAVYRVVTKGVKAGDTRFKVSLTSDQMTSPAEETESTHIFSDE